jgi:hypothetical protein
MEYMDWEMIVRANEIARARITRLVSDGNWTMGDLRRAYDDVLAAHGMRLDFEAERATAELLASQRN